MKQKVLLVDDDNECSIPLPLASVPLGDKRMKRGEGAPARKTYYEIPSIQ